MTTALMTLWAALAWAAPSGQPNADAAYDAGDYLQAARLYSECAERGDAYCRFRLGALYFAGQGVPRDAAKSRELLEKSAAQGFSRAALRLGRQLLFTGERDEGIAWLHKAADAGNADAARLLETQERLGPIAPAAPRAAARVAGSAGQGIVARALDRGGDRWIEALVFAFSAATLGLLVYGVVARLSAPLRSFARMSPARKAAFAASAAAALFFGLRVVRDAHRIARLRRLRDVLTAAEGRDPKAQYELALLYESGADGAPRNPAEARRWLIAASDAGYAPAKEELDKLGPPK